MRSAPEGRLDLHSPIATPSVDDLRNRILKLRWIGMDGEAERLTNLLAQYGTISGVWMAPLDKD